MTAENNNPLMAASLEEQLYHAAEELITGDSDDPPVSEEAVVEMLILERLTCPNGPGLWVGGVWDNIWGQRGFSRGIYFLATSAGNRI